MYGILFRQRRRILISALFLTLAVMLHIVHSPGLSVQLSQSFALSPMLGLSVSAAYAVISFAFFSLLVAAGVLAMPSMRTVAEVISLFLFLVALLHYHVPFLSYYQPFSALWPYFLLIVMWGVMQGTTLDHFALSVDHVQRASFVSDTAPDNLWSLVVPTMGQEASYWDELLQEIQPQDDDPKSFDARYLRGPSGIEDVTHTVLEHEFPYLCRYYAMGTVEGEKNKLSEAIHEIHLEPRAEGGSHVTIHTQRMALSPAEGLRRWMDDDLGSEIDLIRAKETGQSDWTTQWLANRAF